MMSQFYILGNSVKSIVLVILVILKTNLVILDLFFHSDFMGQSKHEYSFAILNIPRLWLNKIRIILLSNRYLQDDFFTSKSW